MSCNCGCGGCQTKNQGPLLMEAKVKSLLSEGLNHHISNKIPLHETVYRYGSIKHLSLIKEARKLYSRNVIDLNEFDVELVKTHLGEWGIFEGESVPLDLPMEEQAGNKDIETLITLVKSAKNPKNLPIYFGTRSVGIGQTQYDKGELVDMFNGRELGMDSMAIRNVFFKANQNAEAVADEINASNSGVVAKVEYGYGKEPILYLRKGTNLDEAKKKKKDPPIGKPKRGGSKAYYVYVRDPKTKKIKKVSFGSGGLRAKINNPKARKAFAARHKCSQKTDRTKASYWSCRLPRYAKALGLGNNKNTFW